MSKELTREDVERECQWLVEEHCQSAARKWDDNDAAQRATIQQLEDRLRNTAQLLIAEIGACGPEDAESAAGRAVAKIQQLEARVKEVEAIAPPCR